VNRQNRTSLPTTTVGQRIRQYRQERHLTQTELARHIGIQQSGPVAHGEGRVPRLPGRALPVPAGLRDIARRVLRRPCEHGLTSREAHLLESFRELPREDQHEILEFVDFKRGRQREPEHDGGVGALISA